MIDWSRVRELRDEIGSDGFEELIDVFLEEVEDGLILLAAASEPGATQSACHFLKGSALNIGFSDFAESCARGEENGTAPSGMDDLYQASKAAFLGGLTTNLVG